MEFLNIIEDKDENIKKPIITIPKDNENNKIIINKDNKNDILLKDNDKNIFKDNESKEIIINKEDNKTKAIKILDNLKANNSSIHNTKNNILLKIINKEYSVIDFTRVQFYMEHNLASMLNNENNNYKILTTKYKAYIKLFNNNNKLLNKININISNDMTSFNNIFYTNLDIINNINIEIYNINLKYNFNNLNDIFLNYSNNYYQLCLQNAKEIEKQIKNKDKYIMDIYSYRKLYNDLKQNFCDNYIHNYQTLNYKIYLTFISNFLGYSLNISIKNIENLSKYIQILSEYKLKKDDIIKNEIDNYISIFKDSN